MALFWGGVLKVGGLTSHYSYWEACFFVCFLDLDDDLMNIHLQENDSPTFTSKAMLLSFEMREFPYTKLFHLAPEVCCLRGSSTSKQQNSLGDSKVHDRPIYIKTCTLKKEWLFFRLPESGCLKDVNLFSSKTFQTSFETGETGETSHKKLTLHCRYSTSVYDSIYIYCLWLYVYIYIP